MSQTHTRRRGSARATPTAPSPPWSPPSARSTPASRCGSPLPGHYASVIRLDERTGIALGTDGVGTKLLVAEQLGRFDTVGIDCIAMNVNDLICVGAEPIALLDYLAVEQRRPGAAAGRSATACAAAPSWPASRSPAASSPSSATWSTGFDLAGAASALVALDAIVTGAAIAARRRVIGLPSSGLHSNGYTLARKALAGHRRCDDERPRAPARRGPARADRDLRQADPRAARSERRRPRPRPHHRRRAQQPAAPRGRRRLRDRRPAAGPADLRADRRAWAASATRRCTRSSTWAAASACVVAARRRGRGARAAASPLPGGAGGSARG